MSDDFEEGPDFEEQEETGDGGPSAEAMEFAVEAPDEVQERDRGQPHDPGDETEERPPVETAAERQRRITPEMWDELARERDGLRGTVSEMREKQRMFAERMAPILREYQRRNLIDQTLDQVIAEHRSVPRFDDDPGGHIAARVNQSFRPVAERLDHIEGRIKEEHETRARSNYESAVREDFEMARKNIPDYDDVIQRSVQSRYEALKQLYPTATDEMVFDEIRRNHSERAKAWLAQGRSPAEGIYHDAVASGYGGYAQNNGRSNNGRQRSDLAERRRAAAATGGVNGRGASASGFTGKDGDVTPEDILSMSPREYARFREEHGIESVIAGFAEQD